MPRISVHADAQFLRTLIEGALIEGPALQLGSREWPGDEVAIGQVCRRSGLEVVGADLVAGPGVDFQLDVLDVEAVNAVGRQWQTVLLFNLLEHLYDPLRALENALRLTAPGGSLVVVGPAVWQLHDYPVDCWRPMPDFFLEFARRNDCVVVPEAFAWLVVGKIIPVSRLSKDGQKQLPSYSKPGVLEIWGHARAYWSRALHRLLGTLGRDTPYPNSGLGVVLRRLDA